MTVPVSAPQVEEADDPSRLPVTLAPMRRRHLRTVVAHEKAVYTQPWTTGLFLSELARPETRSYIVARVGAVLVGHCGVLFLADEGHVSTVVVAPGWQGRGIATRMLLYQFAHAVDRGFDALTLEVRVSNTAARDLYARFGFVPAGIRKGYYAETGEDALIMWAHDIDSAASRRRRAALEERLGTPTRYDNLHVSLPVRPADGSGGAGAEPVDPNDAEGGTR